jgi:hypothetical protein
MSRGIELSDERYQVAEQLAARRTWKPAATKATSVA